MDMVDDKKTETLEIQLKLKVSKRKNGMWLHREIGNGLMPDGTGFRLLDTGSHLVLQHYPDKENRDGWVSYMISKEELADGLVDRLLMPGGDKR